MELTAWDFYRVLAVIICSARFVSAATVFQLDLPNQVSSMRELGRSQGFELQGRRCTIHGNLL